MASTSVPLSPAYAGRFEHNEAHSSGVSWSAVFAGAFATAALSLILLALGAGLGVSAVSPWSDMGASASTIGTGAIIWFLVIEVLSSAMGGYLAGRLRTKWASIHTDEVYFRDTAHGFIAWSVALVVTAAFLTSAATALAGSPAASSAKSQDSGLHSYFVDALFRGDAARPETASEPVRNETAIIFARSLKAGGLLATDRAYLDELVSARIDLPAASADQRVLTVFADAQQDAEKARKALAHALIWTFIALLIGAFSASLSATFGGRQRDHVVTI